jgi:prepilin-type N-terminal cleavage/methylation domain-containing protein
VSCFRPTEGELHRNRTSEVPVWWFARGLAALAWLLLCAQLVYSMKTKLNSRTQRGFTLTELMIVVAVIALLTTIAVPNFARARDTSRLNMIYSNLRSLEGAKDQWAVENNVAAGSSVTNLGVLTGYFRGGELRDVMHETYVPNPIGTKSEADLPAGASLGPFGPGAAITLP